MRSMLLAAAALALAGCGDKTPTATNPLGEQGEFRVPVKTPRGVLIHGYHVDVSMPSVIEADPETNKCDLPLTYEAQSSLPTPAYFDSGSVTAAGYHYSYNRAAFTASMGSHIIPGFAHVGIIRDANLYPAHLGAPYFGNVVIQVVEGTERWFGYLEYECVAAPQGIPSPPGDGGGSNLTDPP